MLGILSSSYLFFQWLNVVQGLTQNSALLPIVYKSLIASLETTVPALPVSSSIKLLHPPEGLYIALNLYENEDILPQMCEQLLYFIDKFFDPEKVYLSIFENGSRDHTPLILQEFKQVLTKKRIRHTIITHNVSWRHYCTESGLDEESIALCLNNETSPFVQQSLLSTSGCTSLRDCPERIRIPLMAQFRNIALFPLFNVQTGNELREKIQLSSSSSSSLSSSIVFPTNLQHLGFDPTVPITSTKVLFLNDILLQATDMVNLLNTENGNYDMVCSIDYELLKIYDTWVVRDLHGKKWSDWYPYTNNRYDTEQLMNKQPFRVFSCWNGAVVVQTDILLGIPRNLDKSVSSSSSAGNPRPVTFRSWYTNESRNVAVEFTKQHASSSLPSSSALPSSKASNELSSFSDACPVSECALFCTDLWLQQRNKIFINPNIGVYYNIKTLYYQRIFMQIFVHPWLGMYRRFQWWYNNVPSVPPIISSPVMDISSSSSSSSQVSSDPKKITDIVADKDELANLWDILPPSDIECGNNNVT